LVHLDHHRCTRSQENLKLLLMNPIDHYTALKLHGIDRGAQARNLPTASVLVPEILQKHVELLSQDVEMGWAR